MLLEYWMTSAKESQPCGWESWMVHLPTVQSPFSQKTRSVGLTMPSSSALAARIALNVEPGS